MAHKPPKTCPVCQKQFIKTDPRTRFCSIQCSGIYFRGEKSPAYRKELTPKSYRRIKFDGRDIRLGRFLMEQKLGRPLEPGEIVHHLDGNSHNDAVDNLVVIHVKRHSSFHPHSSMPKDNPELYRSSTHRTCVRCLQTKPRTEFWKSPANPVDTHFPHCRSCQIERRPIRTTAAERDPKRRVKKGNYTGASSQTAEPLPTSETVTP